MITCRQLWREFYKKMAESTFSLRLTNSTRADLRISLEPWCEEHCLPRGATLTINAMGPEGDTVEIEYCLSINSAVNTVRTVFTISECKQAKYLGMIPSWHYGYPMPDDDFVYLQDFDLTEYCARCGTGLKQLAPFRMKKAPPWGNKSIVQLNWVFDEFFVKPETWTNIFKPFGIECLPVLLHRDGTNLDSVVQLKIERVMDLEMGDSPYEECGSCGRKKYLPITQGFLPQPPDNGSISAVQIEPVFRKRR